MKYTKVVSEDELITLDTKQDDILDIALYLFTTKKKTSPSKTKKKGTEKSSKSSINIGLILLAIFAFPLFIIYILFKSAMEVSNEEEEKAEILMRKRK